jgi:hypothetical protein
LLSCCLAVALGCAGSAPALQAPPLPPPAPGDLRVTLVFGAGADLDLYVTDPSQRTVYFAMSDTGAGGGRLEHDLRCEDPAPRRERVVFRAAAAGRYYVGVDRPEECDDGGDELERFLLIVEHGEQRRETRGEIAPRRFLPRVLELDLTATLSD